MHRIPSIVLLAGLVTALVPVSTFADTTDQVLSSTHLVCVPTGGVAADPKAALLIEKARGWSRERQDAFARLLASADAFGRAVAADEIDHSAGDACQVRATELAERRVFLRMLERAVTGEAFGSPLLTFEEADGSLNAVYREVMAVREPQDLAWGSVEKLGIRRTEQAWLAYRDAFVAFAATLEQPGLAERVKIELTARRATSLEAFLAD